MAQAMVPTMAQKMEAREAQFILPLQLRSASVQALGNAGAGRGLGAWPSLLPDQAHAGQHSAGRPIGPVIFDLVD